MKPTVSQRILSFLPAIIDLAVPTLGYYLLHLFGVSDVWALTIAGSAAGVTTIVNSIRRRRLDALGILVVAELALSVILAVVTRDPKLVLARASLYLAIGGVFLIATCFTGHPATYAASEPMATKGDPEVKRAFVAAWANSPAMRRIHTQLTAGIGIGVLVYAALRLVVIYTASSVSQAVWTQEIPGTLLIVYCIVLIRLRVPALRRIVLAEQAKLTPIGSTR